MTEIELKSLAIDIAEGKVFTDRHLTDQPDMIGSVFMVIGLGGIDQEKVESGEIDMIYEYIDQAGPRSINGLPCFFSCKYLSKDNVNILNGFYQEYIEMKNKFMNETETDTQEG